MRSAWLALALLGLLAACSPSRQQANRASPSGTNAIASATASASNARYSNPFAYCRAVGTLDRPDSRYTGPNPPSAVIAGLVKAFGSPPAATRSPAFTHGTYWRCMKGSVYACNVGANLPCQSRANTDRAPTQGEKKYCAAHPGSDFIPMYVTGHNTIYDWSCKGDQPVAGKQITKVDARGYLANIWYRIPPPGSAPIPATTP
ncbi:MAG: hypothetical protein ACRESR_08395 [Gammaproteobacteria bacterium]